MFSIIDTVGKLTQFEKQHKSKTLPGLGSGSYAALGQGNSDDAYVPTKSVRS